MIIDVCKVLNIYAKVRIIVGNPKYLALKYQDIIRHNQYN